MTPSRPTYEISPDKIREASKDFAETGLCSLVNTAPGLFTYET